jgi:biopolymer transport protein ExbD
MTQQSGNHAAADEVVHFVPRRKRSPRETTAMTLNLAPMVDIVFLLLIFFVTTTTFRRAEGVLPARLPRDSGVADAVALPVTPIVVHVTQTGSGPGEYELRVENFVNAPTTFTGLAAFLADIQGNPGFDDETPVVIKAPEDVVWDHVVGCWNAAVRAGYKRISFGTE